MSIKKEKGFTLIELLSILVILLIIALITVPIIVNVVKRSKKEAAVSSAYGFIDAINKKYMSSVFDEVENTMDGTYAIVDGKIMGGIYTNDEIEVSGSVPTAGSLTYIDDELQSGCLVINGYEVRYTDGVFTSQGKGTCSDLVEDTSNNVPINYTITFNVDGGSSVSEQTIELGYNATEPPTPTKEGYTFGGWYLDSEFTQLYDFNTPITGETTLYAKWIENVTPTYTVTFNSNEGSSVSSQTIEEGQTATEPNEPTRTGYAFNGWYTDSGLTQIFNFSTTITSDITLYAKWTESITYYTVAFYTNGGNNISSQSIQSGQTVTRPTNPTKSGYTFSGWYTDSSLTQAFSFSTEVTSNINLYAKWLTNYTVTFNSNGGTSISSQTVPSGQQATRPSSPSKNYYTFAGWYSNSGLTQSFSFNTAITSNITLYAKWEKTYYTVSFESNGGPSVNDVEVWDGDSVRLPSWDYDKCTSKSGYYFVGWYKNSSLTIPYNYDPITYDTTLYAKWVSLPSNGSTINFTVDGNSFTTTYGTTWGTFIGNSTKPLDSGYLYLESDRDVMHGYGDSQWYIGTRYFDYARKTQKILPYDYVTTMELIK